ncbi:peptidoglycan D,D-transpeptidase FtsI family protein [Bacillus sonorensis]|uniref:peptidoglycan D,D-transpeptidase FtsI family protein n=1 Tax=Bacillus sonorensis TaxID=119858 RepID=UPI000498653C|nr:penicillin-binding protein 2 [Bacillus sonorensis]MCF7617542.1 penicillin-binding protein 2 [Bacillus sonorensis]MCY8404667.1 penicillin-binding protein 2 [Bacillus sonorensis]MEC1439353.1 penicillin-binding protein 2 [Bacillus sonorensis]MEC1536857.1 penicillin-binding protein 2 [Bacillus sonorensis]MEC1590687.1 penicillin-binding protein 2 [Bacillus sonorensis]
MKLRKRMKWISILMSAALLFLLIRLAEIQLFFTESFSKWNVNLIQESVKQRTEEVQISDGRGSFLDRSAKPLSVSQKPAIVLFPFLKKQSWPIEEAAAILHMSKEELNHSLDKAKKPVILTKNDKGLFSKTALEKINKLKYPGIYGVYIEETEKNRLASHTIGMTNQDPELLRKKYPHKDGLSISTKIGTFGLERTFDEFLLPEQDTKLLYHVDGLGNPLFGMDVKYTADANPFYPLQVKTTIDKTIQQSLEEILDDHHLKKGGAVLLDIENSSVLAIASKPDLNMASQKTRQNYMLTPMYPGSVFKTVIAAAAIENGLDHPSKTFNCNLNLYGEPGDDKGRLNMEDGFAESCNYTFTSLADQLIKKNGSIIEDTAEKLGLTGRVGWEGRLYHQRDFKQFYHEVSGAIWGDEQDKKVKKAVAQTAIGQKNVRLTPLEIANMMATIARGGEKKQVKIADEIEYKNGTLMASFKDQELPGKTIDHYTAQKLQKLLRKVVTSEKGTGRRFSDLPYDVAGKSGTAQTDRTTKDHKTLYHKWFAGYFPADKPKYALAVVHMDTPEGKAATNAAFYDIVKKVYEIEKNQT